MSQSSAGYSRRRPVSDKMIRSNEPLIFSCETHFEGFAGKSNRPFEAIHYVQAT